MTTRNLKRACASLLLLLPACTTTGRFITGFRHVGEGKVVIETARLQLYTFIAPQLSVIDRRSETIDLSKPPERR